MKTKELDLQEQCQRFVDREVIYCVSFLVSELTQRMIDDPEYGEDLFQLWQGPPVYGTYTCPECGEEFESDMGPIATCPECKEEFDHEYGEPKVDKYRGVFEHWLVSEWLADQLEARDETVVRNFMGLTIWARTCTGQAIALDSVIKEIVKEINDS